MLPKELTFKSIETRFMNYFETTLTVNNNKIVNFKNPTSYILWKTRLIGEFLSLNLEGS